MAGAASNKVFFAGKLPESGASGAQGDQRNNIFQQDFLLGAKAAADARLDYANFLYGDAQCLRDNAAAVEGDLRGGGDDHTSGRIDMGE